MEKKERWINRACNAPQTGYDHSTIIKSWKQEKKMHLLFIRIHSKISPDNIFRCHFYITIAYDNNNKPKRAQRKREKLNSSYKVHDAPTPAPPNEPKPVFQK